MASSGSDSLFKLIKSLTQSEKRYFKRFALINSSKGSTNYIKLFDVVDKQNEYDENKIIHKGKFNGNNQLPNLKNYLYNLILKSLNSFHSGVSANAQLKEFLRAIEILFKKGLYDECEKIISKAKVLAEKYEKHLVLLELSGWKIELSRIYLYQGKTEDEIGNIYEEVFNVNEKYRNEKEYERLSSSMFMRISKQGSTTRSDADLKVYRDIINHPLLDTENKMMSYQAAYNYYTVYTAYFFMRSDFLNAYSYSQKLVKLMEQHPHQKEEKLEAYIAMLGNLIACQSYLKKHKEIFLTLKKLKEINTKSQRIKNRIFFIVNYTELNIYIDTGEFAQGIKLIPHIEEELDKIDLPKDDEMAFYYNISYIYFGVGNYRAARNYLNKIINDTTVDVRSDIYCMARIMLLIVHYELGHEELLEYMEKSAHRYLDKKNRLYKVETSILDFIKKKLPKVIADRERRAAFKELKTELEEIMRDPFEAKVLDYFDFISWLESKIQNRPFADIIKEKAQGLYNAPRF